MAQNSTKGLQASGGSQRKSKHALNPKKGARSIAPKKTDAIVRRTMQKNLSSKINNSIEKQMVTAASGGKLTIMKGLGDTPAEIKKKKEQKRPTSDGVKREGATKHPHPSERANI